MDNEARLEAMEAYQGAFQQLVATCRDVEADILERLQRQQRHAAAAEAAAVAASANAALAVLLRQQLVELSADLEVPSDSLPEHSKSGTKPPSEVAPPAEAPMSPRVAPSSSAAATAAAEAVPAVSVPSGTLSPLSPTAVQASVWSMAISALDLPKDLQLFYEAQRVIVMDAIRCIEGVQ